MELDLNSEIQAIGNELEALIDSLPDLILAHVDATPNVPFEISEAAIQRVIDVAKDANNEVRLKVIDRMRDLVDGATDVDAQAVQQSFDDVIEFYIRKASSDAANRIQGASIARQIVLDRSIAITQAVDISKRASLDISESEIFASSALFSIATSLENGYSYFRYETSQDQVVRTSHKDRQGKIFIYGKQRVAADVPSLEHSCRCFDFPLSDEEVLENLDKFYYAEDAPAGVAAMTDKFKINANASGVVEISGVIDEWDGNDFTSFKAKVDSTLSANQTLKLAITSHGGDAFAGMAMYSYLKDLPNRVESDIYGHAGSAATHPLAASDWVRAGESDVLLIHKASACACGNSEDLAAVSEQIKPIDEAQVKMYMAKSGRTEKEVRDLMERNEYITAQEALEFGLVDEIRADSAISADARKAYTGRINVLAQAHNLNEDLTMSDKEKLVQLEQEIADLKAANVTAKAEADGVAELTTQLAEANGTITALKSKLEEAENIDIDAKVAERLAAEKEQVEALATAKERVTALGGKPEGINASEIYAKATKDLGIFEEGYEEAQVMASFNAFEKVSGKQETNLGAQFVAQGSGDNEAKTETRAEKAARLKGGK